MKKSPALSRGFFLTQKKEKYPENPVDKRRKHDIMDR